MTTHSDHRLPTAVVPRAYRVDLAPDLDAATFGGLVAIDIEVVEPTSEIVLNAIELDVEQAHVALADGSELAASISLDEAAERLTLSTDELQPGDATLHIAFSGVLNDKLRGFYRSTFTDAEGAERVIATTQFESTNARRAFPCWDEPEHKATFEVTLTHDAELMALSSGPETDRTDLGDGRACTRFAPTMVMSTYLLAFIVGPLEATDPVDVDGVPLRVVHPPGKGHLTSFALSCGEFSLRHFSQYFGIGYPGEKLDLVALPDFAFGAMENLGCVTFREALLILDPETSTQPEQQRAADVIAHEIAHMWFGDLVTMKWWNGIWLKEAFATFCEMHATNAWKPEWKRWEDFSLSRSAAFDVDSLTSTRPIEFEVISPDDAEAMYDVLTYEKGAAVVRMLEQYLGEDAFRDGIRHYLAIHAYGNTETHDLWDAIEETTGQPARQIMDSWIFQGGYPLVRIDPIAPDRLRITQERFGYGEVPATLWSVPVVLAIGTDAGRRRLPALVDAAEVEVELDGKATWVVGNADASGFYRVAMSAEMTDDLLSNLDALSAVERYGLLDDAWAAVVADRLEVQRCIEIVQHLAAGESDLAVWRRIAGVLSSIDRHLTGDARAAHRTMAIALVNTALDRFGRLPVPGESDHDAERRAVLFETAGVMGDPTAIAVARELFDTPADPARTAAALRIIAANGDAADFAAFVARYGAAATPQEERRYLFALAGFPGDSEITTLLSMVDDEEVRSQDAGLLLGRALSNDEAAALVWAYIETTWDRINERLPSNAIPRMLEGAKTVGDPEVADAIERFFAHHEVPQAGQTLFQHLERMRVSVELRRRLRASLS